MTGQLGRAHARSVRPPRYDVVFAVVVAVGCLAIFVARSLLDDGADREPQWAYVFPVLASLMLAFRRARPVPALVAMVAVAVVYLMVVESPGPIVIPVLIGLYSVASQSDRRTAILAAASAAILISVAALTIAPGGPSAVGFGAGLSVTIIPILIGDAVRSRRALIAATDERVRLAEEGAEQLARQQLVDERVRIARELHDVVAHSIATITVQAGVAAHVMDDESGVVRDALLEIKASSKSALAELRSMLGVLREHEESALPLAPSPGIADISTLTDRYVGPMSYDTVGHPAHEVSPIVGLVAYRIVQESLTNVMKHAQGAPVAVQLDYGEQSLSLSIRNGPGQATAPTGGGLGLTGLKERVRAIGGSLAATPRFDAGFDVTAEFPYTPGESDKEGNV